MQPTRVALFILAALLPSSLGEQVQANPLGKVLELIEDLAAKIESDGEKQDKAYNEYLEWCDDTAKDTKFAIESATAEKGKLEAKIGELTSHIEVATTKIDELAAAISEGETQLKKATAIREKEAAEFKESEKELTEAIDALGRAMGILEKEMKKGASLAQVDTANMEALLPALSAVMDAAAFTGTDRDHLEALLQAQDSESDEDGELGAPAAAKYKAKSGGIVDVLTDMKEKAEAQLGDTRKAEVKARNDYEMLKQSLTDQLKADKGDLAEEKSAKAAAGEGKANSEGELDVTVKELKGAEKELATAQSTCMTMAADHQVSVAAREEELKVVKEALKILQETTDGAAKQTGYSFMQVSSSAGTASKTLELVKKLAKKHHSSALAQLASRMNVAIRYGEDPFAKIKGLIQDMIMKLEKEAESEANEKAYCDEEMKDTEAKKSDLEDSVGSMTTKLDQAISRSSQLKEQVQELQNELAVITREQAEMDKIRADGRAAYQKAKADLELGISGVRKALKVLRDYYAQDKEESLLQEDDDDKHFGAFMQQPAPPQKFEKSGGAGSSIIGILEVTESDFAKELAKVETEESEAVSEHEKMSQENKVASASKEQDVKFKTQESKGLAKTIAEVSSDRDTSNTELSAVLEYYAKLKDRCVAQPSTFDERVKRRAAEIEGLKEALTVLEDEAAFLQRKQRRHRRARMRGTLEASE